MEVINKVHHWMHFRAERALRQKEGNLRRQEVSRGLKRRRRRGLLDGAAAMVVGIRGGPGQTLHEAHEL